MKRYLLKNIFPAVILSLICGLSYMGQVFADEKTDDDWDTFEVMPIRFINVKGDAAKFRALNWVNDGSTGGIKDMTFEGDVLNGRHLSFEGHVIPGDNDWSGNLELTKDNGGYLKLNYSNFRRYFDVYGGYYANFSTTPSISRLAADPKVDVGNFFLEFGSAPEDEAGISLSYERFTKDGIKSMLDWGTATQGSLQRKIIPSWEEIGTVADTVTLKANTDVAGFGIHGKQQVEFFNGRIFREDDSRLASTPALTSQEQEPQAKQLISSLKADRWIVDDKTYLAFAYQFQHLRNDLSGTVRNYDSSGAVTSNSRNVVTDAQSSHDAHTWVEHFVTDLSPNLNFITKFKQEVVSQTGTSFSKGYTGGSDYTMESENAVMRTGESLSLRYKGIPKTSLYSDIDFQQSRNWLSKWLKIVPSAGAATTTYYENLNRNPEMTGVVGARYVPNSKFNMTSQYRYKSDNNTYDTFFNNDVGISLSRLRTNSNEWDNRFTWKPWNWFQNSFRLQLMDNVYRVQTSPQYVVDNDWIKSHGDSKIYTYNLVLQPWAAWLFDLGYSFNTFKVSTPASQTNVATGGIPVSLTNVYTWLFTTSYSVNDDLSIFGSSQFSRADNFDDQGFAGIPYGVDSKNYDVNVGMNWSPKKDFTIKPSYGYYSYRANESMDYGNYSAHLFMLDAKFDW